MNLPKIGNNITFVHGRICSGKGYICDLYKKQGIPVIHVSDIVRELVNSKDRKSLQDSASLGADIAVELVSRIGDHDGPVIVEGVRQVDILEYLSGIEQPMHIWIECSDEIRNQRFITRNHEKDQGLTLADADAADVQLGISCVESYVKLFPSTTILFNE